MNRHTMTLMAWATLSCAPVVIGAQAVTTPPTTTPTVAPGTCDCPEGDTRGELRNLAAFAPLGLLGALAAAGGAPALLATNGPAPLTDAPAVASNTPTPTDPPTSGEAAARSAAPSDPRSADIPTPVSPDSMRAGVRAPNTGTPLPSILLLGSGLMAVGCVTILRSRG
jgi:hypothetical protein